MLKTVVYDQIIVNVDNYNTLQPIIVYIIIILNVNSSTFFVAGVNESKEPSL